MGGKKYIAAILAGALVMSTLTGAAFAVDNTGGAQVGAVAVATTESSISDLYLEVKPIFENGKIYAAVVMKNFKKYAVDTYGVQFSISYGDNKIKSYEFTDFKDQIKDENNQDKRFISAFNSKDIGKKVTLGLVGDFSSSTSFDDEIVLIKLEMEAASFKDGNLKIDDVILIDNTNQNITSRVNIGKSCTAVAIKRPTDNTSNGGNSGTPTGGGSSSGGGGSSSGGGGSSSGGGGSSSGGSGSSSGGGGSSSGGGNSPAGAGSSAVTPTVTNIANEEVPKGINPVDQIKVVVKEVKTIAVESTKKAELAPFKDEVKLEIPENTFSAPIEIKVSKIDTEKSNIKMEASSDKKTKLKKYSEVYDFDAKGSSFKKPVTVTFAYAAETGTNEEKLGVYTLNEITGTWDFVGGHVDTDKNTITAELKHFSKYSVMLYDKTFDDIKGHWAKDNIEFFAAKHMASGVSENMFDPDGNVTRAQFVTLLVKAFGMDVSKNSSCFKDVKDGEWYKDYVMTAKEAGITNGTSKDEFEPDATITREQMATMIMNAYNVLGKKDYKAENIEKSNFKDNSSISDWAIKAIDAAKSKGIINGYDKDNFAPKMTATRAQAITMIKKLYDIEQ